MKQLSPRHIPPPDADFAGVSTASPAFTSVFASASISWLVRLLTCEPMRWIAWFVVALAILAPQDGRLGYCFLKSATGLPCFGCGMTRSLLAWHRGQPLLALAYHPLWLLLYPWLLWFLFYSLLPAAKQHTFRRGLISRQKDLTLLWWTGCFLFFLFGTSRLLYLALEANAHPFP